MADKKGVKINTTTETSAGDVLGSTLEGMEQWNMNVVKDVGGSHSFNGKNAGKK